MEEFSLLSSRPNSFPYLTNTSANIGTTTNTAPTVPHPVTGKYDHIFTRGVDALIKKKISSHPQYPLLLEAFIDCQKVGAPPEIVDRLSTVCRELKLHHRSDSKDSSDPELDQFMESYSNMLLKYKEELMRPIQEAAQFFKSVQSELSSLSLGLLNTDEKCEGIGSSEEDHDTSTADGEILELDPSMEDKELKNQLLKKYSGYLSSLWKELSKKKKKGKLPKDARQKLLSWWEHHYKWPYPSETDKVTLAESTGLDPKQINNWFINQRKRHWKPSEDMQFVVMDGSYPHNAGPAAFYMEGQFMGDTLYHHLGP